MSGRVKVRRKRVAKVVVRRKRRVVTPPTRATPDSNPYPCVNGCGRTTNVKNGNCAVCFLAPAQKQKQLVVDTEPLKALLRQSGVNVDKILADDLRAFRRSLRQR